MFKLKHTSVYLQDNVVLINFFKDMRKALPRDKEKKSEIPRGRDVYPYELQHF
jgi:hypothetical protein